jgi:D-alanyl-D-alanine carboxypeptidase
LVAQQAARVLVFGSGRGNSAMIVRRKGECLRSTHTTPLATWTLALVCLALNVASPAHAGGDHALFIIDANTGATLANQDGTDPRYPASLTKMMTIYMAFDAVQRGTTSLQSPVKFSVAATKAAPSKLDLDVGDTITLENAILALITKSANDVAIAVAEHLGGTETNFAKMMTAKARELGMKNTTFKNASGLPDGEQTTTARDMTTLGLRLYDDFPKQFPLFSTRSFAYNGASYRNHNTLMLQMPGINGIKTGYTHASGFNLVSSLQQDGKHVIGAIFGGSTANSRNLSMRIALAKAMSKASSTKTRKPVLLAQASPAKPVARAPALTPAPVAAAPKAAAVAPAPVVAATAPVASPAPVRIDIAKVRPATAQETATVVPPAARAPDPVSPPPQAFAPAAFAQASIAPKVADPVKPKAPEPAPVARAAIAAAPTPAGSGVRPPSSLNAQMAQLSAPAAQPNKPAEPSFRLNGPATPSQPTLQTVANTQPTPSGGSNYDIQIGAYASPAEADRRMTSAATLVPTHLKNRRPNRQQVSVGDKTLYRARFSGFDQSAAAAACAELNRQSINCIALKAE